MKVLVKYSAILSSLLMTGAVFAQNPMNADRAVSQPQTKDYANENWRPSLVPDGMIDRVADHTNRTLDWNPIRENDVAFKRRFWKRIDVKERQNMPFIYQGDEYSGGGAFIEILLDGIKRGKFRAFSDDNFNSVLSYDDIASKLSTEQTITTYDPVTGEPTIKTIRNDFNPQDISMYEVQEDYIFDRNAGRMRAFLRAVTAKKAKMDETTGDFLGFVSLFTIYYPEARPALSQYEVYNPENDVHRMSWTDYLDRMMYSAYVLKTSRNNPTGDNIQGGLRGLYEGQQEMDKLIQKEMDMWEL